MSIKKRLDLLETKYEKQQKELEYFVSIVMEFVGKDYAAICEKLEELDDFKQNIKMPIDNLNEALNKAMTSIKSSVL